MNLISLVSMFLPLAAFTLLLHPIHVSVTEIEYDKKDQALEIMMRVFIDDLELTLRNSFNKPQLDVLKPEGTTLDEMMAKYLHEHFTLALDKKPAKTRYLGHEREGEAFIFYIEVQDVQEWNTITIKNDIIMGTYDDQSNIVHVYVGDDVKSIRLTARTPVDDITFQ